MSVATFIPKIWSARLTYNLDKAMVYGNLVNRDYEGEISESGDTVHINSIGEITIKKYAKGTDIDSPEELSTTSQTLVVDQSDYFNFGIDDVDAAQVKAPLMDKFMQRASYGMADIQDKFIATTMAKAATIKLGSSSTPINITPENAYNTLVDLKVAMDKKNVPTEGRWIVVPPDMEGVMLKDPIRFATANSASGDDKVRNGLIARAAGFDIYISNNVPETANKYSIIASNNSTTTFAQQLTKVEAYRPESSFKDAMKGLNLYGAKTTQGEAVALLIATFGVQA